MAKEPESRKLPIQTDVARGISNSKRVKAIELSTSMIAKDVFAIKSLGGVGAGGKKDDDKDSNGKIEEHLKELGFYESRDFWNHS